MYKRTDILSAAQQLFSQFGLKKVTTDEIASEAGVSKATIYKHYKNKHEIFQEVVQMETNLMLSKIQEAISRETTAEAKLKAFLLTKTQTIHELINFYKVTRLSRGQHWPYIEEVRRQFMEEEKAIIKAILEYGQKQKELSVKNVELHSHILTISFKSVEYPWSLEGLDCSIEDIVDLIVDAFMYGVSDSGRHSRIRVE